MLTIKKRNYFISLILIFILGAGSCFGLMYLTGFGENIVGKDYEKYSRLSELEEYLKENYYTDITNSAITTGLYRGLFSSVNDPYTVYYTKEEFEQVNNEAHGENSGIGVVMQSNEEDLIEIIQVIEGTPAENAGIKKGDSLVAVDGEEFAGSQTAEAAAKVRGKPNTKVKITVLRDGKKLTFEITRDNFVNPSVSSEHLDDNIGYISISTFNDNTAEDFKSALETFESENVKGLVIDIRNNVGGIVSQGVEIADLLLDKAEIAYAENNKKEREVYETKDGKTTVPYALLINENSASTSEILAIGIKENKGGYLVGETTYGKGLIQKLQQFDEKDGVRITIMQYFSASGQPINNVGVEPDHKVKIDKDSKTDIQLKKALSLFKQ